jgi:hypothetical protein
VKGTLFVKCRGQTPRLVLPRRTDGAGLAYWVHLPAVGCGEGGRGLDHRLQVAFLYRIREYQP